MFEFKYKNYNFNCDIGTMTPNQYIKMILMLEDNKPKRICELGSGQSTTIFDIYCKQNNAKRYSIENNLEYLRDGSLLMLLKLNTELSIGLYTYKNCAIYCGLEQWLESQDKFDFVFIDGPNDGVPYNFMNVDYARILMLSFLLLNKLTDLCIVMYHDSERNLAQATLSEFEKIANNLRYAYEKEVITEQDHEIVEYNSKILLVCPELTIYKLKKNDTI